MRMTGSRLESTSQSLAVSSNEPVLTRRPWTEGSAQHRLFMPFEHRDRLARCGIPDARRLVFGRSEDAGAVATEDGAPVLPGDLMKPSGRPEAASQMRARSRDAVRTRSPEGLNAALETDAECRLKTRIFRPTAPSHPPIH